MLDHRVIEPELLDGLPPDQAQASLGDLVRINRHFGGYGALRSLLDEAVPRDGAFTFMDIGAASGDMGRQIVRLRPRALVTSLDYVASHLALAPHPKLVADAFQLPIANRSFDYVFCSLFLHHFTEDQIVVLLSDFSRIARRGVLVVDLHRHWIPFLFLPATRWLFGWDPITVHDGRISVAAAFKPAEMEGLATRGGLRGKARTHGLSFRITLSILVK